MVLSYDAIADGVTAGHAVNRVLQTIPLPQVAPRQRAAGGYLAPAGAPAPQAVTAPPGTPGGYSNGAHAAPGQSGLPDQGAGSQRSWGPSA
jgi:MoxR-like ATPase